MDYDRAAATSLRLLTSFGKSITLRSMTAGTYDTTTGTVSAATETDATRKAVFLDFKQFASGQKLRDGSLIQSGDRRCLLDADGTAPTYDSQIVDGATKYTIWDIKEVNPAGTPVLYDLVVRR